MANENSNELKNDAMQHALCPLCEQPATKLMLLGGWRFECVPCKWKWGHPQMLSALDARRSFEKARKRRNGPTTLEELSEATDKLNRIKNA